MSQFAFTYDSTRDDTTLDYPATLFDVSQGVSGPSELSSSRTPIRHPITPPLYTTYIVPSHPIEPNEWFPTPESWPSQWESSISIASTRQDNANSSWEITNNRADQVPFSPVQLDSETWFPSLFEPYDASQPGPSQPSGSTIQSATTLYSTTTDTIGDLVYTPSFGSSWDHTPESDIFEHIQFPDAIVESGDIIASSSFILSQLESHMERQTHDDYIQHTSQQQGGNDKGKQPEDAFNGMNAASGSGLTMQESTTDVSQSSQEAQPSEARVTCPYIDPITGNPCSNVSGHRTQLKNKRNLERHYITVHVQYELMCIDRGMLLEKNAVALKSQWARPNVYVCPKTTCTYKAEHGGEPWRIESYKRIERDVQRHKKGYHPVTLRPSKTQCKNGASRADEHPASSSTTGSRSPPTNTPLPPACPSPGPSKRRGQKGSKSSRQGTSTKRYQPY